MAKLRKAPPAAFCEPKTAAPLHIVPHTGQGSAQAALAYLRRLRDAYPSVRFGMVYTGKGTDWLVFRVDEQHQRGGLPEHRVSDGLSDGLEAAQTREAAA